MKEYNWRQEREKFRTDFSRQESPAGGKIEITIGRKPVPPKSLAGGVLGALLLLAVIAAVLFFCFRSGSDSSTQLAQAAEKNKAAVGLVTLDVELQNGRKIVNPIGTAWAFSENSFATNGHVANGLRSKLMAIIEASVAEKLMEEARKQNCKSVEELFAKLGNDAGKVKENARKEILAMIKDVRASVIINGTLKKSYYVKSLQVHKDYGVAGTRFNPDVAVLNIEGRHDQSFKLADKKTLHNLKSGTPIAFLGFPMENLDSNNVNIDNPVASMQSGIVVAVTDFDMKDSGKERNFLLRHTLPATGGASGSPIFNKKGEVVALLYAGNVIGQVSGRGNVVRAPSAAQINFGVRVDLLSGVGEAVTVKDFLKL